MLYAENGIFGLSNNAPDLGIDESYVGETGALNSLIENAINDQKLFDGIMRNEFTEAAKAKKLKKIKEDDITNGSNSDGAQSEAFNLEAELISFQEASLGDMGRAVIAYIVKIAKKLKGIIMSAITRLGALFTRDNKALVSKYKSKVAGKDLSKLKYKWYQPKGKLGPEETRSMAAITVNSLVVMGMNASDQDSISEKLSGSDVKDEVLSSHAGIGDTSVKEYKKDSFEAHFNDKSEETGVKNDRMTAIINVLNESGKKIEGYKTLLPKINKVYNDAVNAAKKAAGKASGNAEVGDTKEKAGSAEISNHKLSYGGDSKRSSSEAAKVLSNIQKAVKLQSEVSTLVFKTNVSEYKFYVKECRSLFVKAAAYNPKKSTNENAVYLDALEEATDYEFDSNLEELELN